MKIIIFMLQLSQYYLPITQICHLLYPFMACIQCVSGIWTSLTLLNWVMVVWFWMQGSFRYCPSCLKKWCLFQKWSKVTQKKSSRFVILNFLSLPQYWNRFFSQIYYIRDGVVEIWFYFLLLEHRCLHHSCSCSWISWCIFNNKN